MKNMNKFISDLMNKMTVGGKKSDRAQSYNCRSDLLPVLQ